MKNIIHIDGSFGEGGGQVLRSSLALSAVSGLPFRIERIRAGRKKPGLLRQHLTAARAAAEVCGAKVSGDEIGSTELTFEPGEIRAGDYEFAVGTAGSCTLVLQTVLPPLLAAGGHSRVTLEGGTHNPWAPPFHFLDRVFLPLLARMGVGVHAQLERHGFYPAGGGRFTIDLQPPESLGRLELTERGASRANRGRVLISRIPVRIGQREVTALAEKLGWPRDRFEVVEVTDSPGPGNVFTLELEHENVTEMITGFGQRGVPAEVVADRAWKEAREYLATDAAVGRHLADQLLIPMAMAGGGKITTLPLTRHTTTNIEVIQKFLEVGIEAVESDRRTWTVKVSE